MNPRPPFNDSTLAVYNAPGVQVEFYSPVPNDSFTSSDCTVYGSEQIDLQLCVKQDGEEILAGCHQYLALT